MHLQYQLIDVIFQEQRQVIFHMKIPIPIEGVLTPMSSKSLFSLSDDDDNDDESLLIV